MKLTRTYNLALEVNKGKLEIARYSYERHLQLVNVWAGKLFFNGNKSLTTKGLGRLANQAQHRARGIIAALIAANKATGNKSNVPIIKKIGCPAKLQNSLNSFDYWLTVENQFTKAKRIAMPVKAHKKFNEALRNGWTLSQTTELYRSHKGKWYARVYVQKEVQKAQPKAECMGVDVGYTHGACDSDGYIGTNTGKKIKASRRKQASRQSQGLKSFGTPKSQIKQLLDREAKRAVDVAVRTSRSLAIERRKVVARLGRNSLQGWASAYFADRCSVLAKENGVFLWEENPAYTSQTCSHCGHRDKRNRSGISFICVECGHTAHADINAARNIAWNGTVSLWPFRCKQSGTVTASGDLKTPRIAVPVHMRKDIK
jgi:hypothetical protein